MSYFLAVDVGGTKTDYVLADETRTLARVRSGTIKRLRIDEATASANLEWALCQLAIDSGVRMKEVTQTCVGTAGETVSLVTDWLRQSFGKRVGGKFLLLGDVEIALDAAFHGASGVLVMAGTGSNVAGRASSGELTTAGGWGPALADQGSGYRIGQEALRTLFLAHDEGRSSLLLPAVLKFWQLDTLDSLVACANTFPAPDFSRLTELVLRSAEQGDEVAMSVLRQQGEELGHLVRLVIRRLKFMNQSNWVPTLAFTGSIIEKVLPVRTALIHLVRTEFPDLQAMAGVVDPIDGALWRARKEHCIE
jgi:N-acetylglucosamine kinase-like BadF-type ATPase